MSSSVYINALVPWLSSKQFNVMDDVGSIPIRGSMVLPDPQQGLALGNVKLTVEILVPYNP